MAVFMLMVSFLVKSKNLQINYSLSLVTSPNPGVGITLFVIKYDLRVGFSVGLFSSFIC
jgi:hypothetical protein